MLQINGTLVASAQNSLSFHNRGLQYGDAVFETLKVSAQKILFWEDHYFRLMASMRIMRMEIPMDFTLEALETQILETVNASEKASAYRVKLLVWRSWGGKYTPSKRTVSYGIEAEPLENPFYLLNEAPYEVELFKDHYINSGLLSTIKSTNRAINVLGSIYAEENAYENCLLINENKQVVEALNGNLFLVKGYTIKTAPLADGCLDGILRKQLLAILQNMPDYILDESSISPFELQKADEMWITNTIVGIQPVSKFRKKEYKATVAKEFLAKLNVKARLG